jgi:hypothetical protein
LANKLFGPGGVDIAGHQISYGLLAVILGVPVAAFAIYQFTQGGGVSAGAAPASGTLPTSGDIATDPAFMNLMAEVSALQSASTGGAGGTGGTGGVGDPSGGPGSTQYGRSPINQSPPNPPPPRGGANQSPADNQNSRLAALTKDAALGGRFSDIGLSPDVPQGGR